MAKKSYWGGKDEPESDPQPDPTSGVQMNPKDEDVQSVEDRPQKAPDPDKGDLPAAEPKDLTREAAGDYSTPPPGYDPPRSPGGPARVVEEGDVPRVIDPSDRSPDVKKVQRYKIRADIPGDVLPTWYILAKDEDSAIKHYMERSGLQKKFDRAKRANPQALEPEMVVTRLQD